MMTHLCFTVKSIFRLKRCAALIVLIGAAMFAHSPSAFAQDEVSDLFGRINALRASVGRSAYALNGTLSAAAQSQAQWMVDTGTIDHFRPDGSNPRSRAMNAGYPSAMVSENIYGGSNASASVAWSFWVNSAIHYAGLTSANYSEVGIGIAGGGWGRAYVLVFGNPGVPPAASAGSAGGEQASNAAAAVPQRIYAIGVDEAGNIQHLIATGDTLGDIALIYGYTWDDVPRMMALNSLADARSLLPGEIFLVPPSDATEAAPTVTVYVTATPIPATITPFVFATPTSAIPTANLSQIATASGGLPAGTVVVPPDVLATMRVSELPAPAPTDAPVTPTHTLNAMSVAAVSTPASEMAALMPQSTATAPRNNTQQWILIALAVQVGVVALAGLEFARRSITRRADIRRAEKPAQAGRTIKRGRG
ncbi:MAG: CAP domain-containing protein [bacterium]|nr:CAP domain-containing protein [bacterium]